MSLNELQIGTEVSGKVFNEYYKNRKQGETKFYKFLNRYLKHHDFTYIKGLNIDTKPFNPSGSCLSGGLYFCEESNCHVHFEHYGDNVAIIKIPDDARVYIEHKKFKADRLIIEDIISFSDMPDDFWISMIPDNGRALIHIKNKSSFLTEEICISAVQKNGLTLEYVDKQFQTEDVCTAAIKQHCGALQFVETQTPLLCELAIEQYGCAIDYVKEQTPVLCMLAVQQDGDALEYVKKQTPEICEAAVQHDGNALGYVKKQTDKICTLAVQQNGSALRYVKNQTFEICKLAVQQDLGNIVYVKILQKPFLVFIIALFLYRVFASLIY